MTFCGTRWTAGCLGMFPCFLPCGFQVVGGFSAEASEAPADPNRIQLLSHDHSWRFESSGTDLGIAWRAEDYDDRAWSSGSGALDWEDPAPAWPINTWLTLDAIPTFYFRTAFNFTENPAAFDLVFTNLIDDGAVFYLHGQEVARVRMPGGPVTHHTFATSF